MLIGYARVSTQDQNLELQYDALRAARCEQVFEDKMSGTKATRPGLTEALSVLQRGDTLIIWKLSRLGRSLKQLIETVQLLRDKGIELKSLHESIDTVTAVGRLLFHIIAALAEFERENTVENTLAGLASARTRGRIGGRRPLMDETMRAKALGLRAEAKQSITEICQMLGVSRATFYRHLGRQSR